MFTQINLEFIQSLSTGQNVTKLDNWKQRPKSYIEGKNSLESSFSFKLNFRPVISIGILKIWKKGLRQIIYMHFQAQLLGNFSAPCTYYFPELIQNKYFYNLSILGSLRIEAAEESDQVTEKITF